MYSLQDEIVLKSGKRDDKLWNIMWISEIVSTFYLMIKFIKNQRVWILIIIRIYNGREYNAVHIRTNKLL